MSTSIGQYGASAASLILAAGVQQLTDTQTTLAWQTSNDGIISDTYAGLGTARSSVFQLTPKITQVQSWQSNITNAQNSLSVTSTALEQIVSLAQTMAANLLSISGTTEASTVSTTASEASSTLDQIATALNTSTGSSYVFAGQDSTEAPIQDPSDVSTGSLSTTIANALSTLSSGGSVSDVLTAATEAMNSDTTLFSSTISTASSDGTASLTLANSQQTSTVTGDSTSTTYGIVATQGSTSDVSDTSTGSPIKDLIRDMMLISGMSGMSSSSTGYSDLVTQLHTSLVNTTNQIINMETTVGAQQNALTTRSTLLTNTTTALETQLSNARTTDIATVAVQTTNVQDSLKASFILISDMKDMTLANYI
ncbi:flagellin [Acetobacter ghanensis]|uniref:Flagellar hook-associated protein 3 FlgL n=1 Tax=Acetobacter ghanensis TaxID=431306 RepID=A0A0U5F0W4_9PROT|nr:flagellin [Acetobacter ghanensis]NHO39742.1 flagellin [Acetobacter ghanensis]GBQ49114.1 flagellar hook-associated protein FlgL [Acetobacter ghanensis DSM 18895]CEF53416.1 flagellar hook-associated protein 3 FlgL [Acetobacter ghanensis]